MPGITDWICYLRRAALPTLGAFSTCLTTHAQQVLPELRANKADTSQFVKSTPPAGPRLRWVAGGIVGGSAAVVTTLGATWYTSDKQPFRWIDDRHEWAQIDKAGHVWGAFQESRAAVDALRWAGLSPGKALAWGAPVGLVLQSTIEYFDGRSPGYGASPSDMAANVIGSGLLAGELALWGELRLFPKMGVHLTPFAPQRPNTLGHSVAERLLKDYNGQTHWLSADVGAFMGPDTRWPRWLNVAVGYGANDMLYGSPTDNARAGYRAYRQIYFGPDFHLLGIRTRHKFLRSVFYVLSIVRLPAPALEFSTRRGVRLHGLYF